MRFRAKNRFQRVPAVGPQCFSSLPRNNENGTGFLFAVFLMLAPVLHSMTDNGNSTHPRFIRDVRNLHHRRNEHNARSKRPLKAKKNVSDDAIQSLRDRNIRARAHGSRFNYTRVVTNFVRAALGVLRQRKLKIT